jgi:hypothetical protein
MKRIVPGALLAFVTAGCLGSGAAPAPSTQPKQEEATAPATSLRLTYPVGRIVSKRRNVPACPAGATCRLLHLPARCQTGVLWCPPRPWLRVAHRQLTCSPSGGDYSDAATACSALADLMRLRTAQPVAVCSCPAQPYRTVRARARGPYLGKRVSIPLDFCSLCSLGAGSGHDAHLLLPQI